MYSSGAACLPHARGGVSTKLKGFCKTTASSPRTWGCFLAAAARSKALDVFPTHVGVFPSRLPSRSLSRSLPHARGGVSAQRPAQGRFRVSSPRTWGCFYGVRKLGIPCTVFPTHVGVFLGVRCWPALGKCLPHARGGVSMLYRSKSKAVLSSPRTWGVPLCSPAAPGIKKAASVCVAAFLLGKI